VSYDTIYQNYYFRLTAIFPDEPASSSPGRPPASVLEANLFELVEQVFYGLDAFPVIQSSVSRHWKECKALTLTSGLASSFLHLLLDSWQKDQCSLYASSPDSSTSIWHNMIQKYVTHTKGWWVACFIYHTA